MASSADVIAIMFLAISSGAPSSAERWSLRTSVAPASGEVTVGDLVDLPKTAQPTTRAAIVMRVPRTGITLPAATVARLVRRRIPGAPVETPAAGTTVRIAGAPPSPRRSTSAPGPCFRARHALPAGTPVRREDVERTDCAGRDRRAELSFVPATRQYRTVGRIAEGQLLGRLPALDAIAIDRGAQVQLQSRQGPVTIERRVTLLQPGRAGKRVFVATTDGAIVSAPVAIR